MRMFSSCKAILICGGEFCLRLALFTLSDILKKLVGYLLNAPGVIGFGSERFSSSSFQTQRYIRVYDLSKQELLKKLQSSAKWISSMAIHPKGKILILWYMATTKNTGTSTTDRISQCKCKA